MKGPPHPCFAAPFVYQTHIGEHEFGIILLSVDVLAARAMAGERHRLIGEWHVSRHGDSHLIVMETGLSSNKPDAES